MSRLHDVVKTGILLLRRPEKDVHADMDAHFRTSLVVSLTYLRMRLNNMDPLRSRMLSLMSHLTHQGSQATLLFVTVHGNKNTFRNSVLFQQVVRK